MEAAARMPDEVGTAEIMDRVSALARVEGDAGLLAEMAAIFLTDCDSVLATIRGALARNDGARAAAGAHSLKGSLASLSATESRKAAGELETQAISGQYPGALETWDRLVKALARLRPVLEELSRPAGR